MILDPMEVVGTDGVKIEVKPGEEWPCPYRGSGYSTRWVSGQEILGWRRDPLQMQAAPHPQHMYEEVRRVKNDRGGSFRITAHGAVITKVQDEHDEWIAKYVGLYDEKNEPLTFEQLDTQSDLKLGMYWTGLPFDHGDRWTVSPSLMHSNTAKEYRYRLRWENPMGKYFSTRKYPELGYRCLDIRPSGGRIYITESGSIWMNIPDEGMASHYRKDFMKMQREQIEKFQAKGDRAAAQLRLLHERVLETNCRPIFVGQIEDFDHGEPPWTSFSSSRIPTDYTDV